MTRLLRRGFLGLAGLLLALHAVAGFRPSLLASSVVDAPAARVPSTAPGEEILAACGDDRGLAPGMEVVLGRHVRLAGADYGNWLPAMDAWVGARTTVRRVLPERDLAGCAVAVVEADEGRFSWRVADMEVVTARPGWGDWPTMARKILLEADADGSGALEAGEVATLDCALLQRVDAAHRSRVPLSVRVAFGFQPAAVRYRGAALGIDAAHREAADQRLAFCGIAGDVRLGGAAASGPDAARD